ncbi:circadian clock protein KaiC [Acuticoccus sediminis]|uniref:non-specific serine/threonine protein kinase n=1 Tax=Acuticoccus sediminis TaxID=2184697 RepID=A0A8B2NS98_9HYPH|nr:circadian clock protein KaiC [Acuticoccus sediminis]RAI03088.1 circadian clock protein KaiC [Acuticoccus sediminis]
MPSPPDYDLSKLPSGIAGFDAIAYGGVPEGGSTLIAGTSGAGKTVFALQFLHAGATKFGQNAVFVTCEERPARLVRNVRGFGWDLERLVEEKKFAIVDLSADPQEEQVDLGTLHLTALLARIEAAVRRVDAKRVVLDSVGSLFPQFADPGMVRRELLRIISYLLDLGTTVIVTIERGENEQSIGRFGVEEYIADNVVILRNRLERETRRRTIEILKTRGTIHQRGEYPFTIDREDGLTVVPLSSTTLEQSAPDSRITSGIEMLDQMTGGGLYESSIILVSGATGTGKTLMVAEQVRAAIRSNQKILLFAAEEGREQLCRNAAAWGVDFVGAEESGLLRIESHSPEEIGLEDHLLRMKRRIAEFEPSRIAVDSLSAFERVSTPKSFREFVIGLTSYVKVKRITALFTNTTSLLMGTESVTETHISTITDSIILLRYVEINGEMRRGIMVLKMRGTWHEKAIREYLIDGTGMRILGPFTGIHGILSGVPTYTFSSEAQRLEALIPDDEV